MIDSINKYLQFGALFCGIEHTSIDEKDKVVATLLKKKKKELTIEKIIETDSLEKLTQKISSKQPVFLIINNEHVLTKRIDDFQANNLKAINQAFPNINLDDFYYEILPQKGTSFISLCRKKYVEELIGQYTAQKIHVFDFSLGNLIATTVVQYCSSSQITTSNAIIQMENSRIAGIEKARPEAEIYDINGLDVGNHALLSFSGALRIVVQHGGRETNFFHKTKILRDDYLHLRFFDLFSKFSLIFILGLLVVNFLFFNHYYTEMGRLQQNAQSNQTLKNKIGKMDQDVLRSQKMVENILRGNSSKSSFYVNDIAQSLPYSIILGELNFQPLSKQIKEGEPVIIVPHLISVSGQSSNNKMFSKWLREMGSLDWVGKVEIISYADISTSKSNFEIVIIIKNEQ